MKKLIALIFAFSLSSAVNAAAPSPETIEKLLELTGAEKMLDAMRPQIDNMMKASMVRATQGKAVSQDEQKVLDKFTAKVIAIIQSELTMNKMKSMYIDIYSKNFTQEEINGLIVFYESEAGKAFVAKMPIVMQSLMSDMPRRMAPMMQEMQKATEEMKQELTALKQKKHN